jgi:hypothetical protein
MNRPAPARSLATPARQELPVEYDHAYYVGHPHNGDLRALDETVARHHYEVYGRNEGRPCCPIDSRGAFLGLLPRDADLLEIGPFCTPCFTPATHRVHYLDVFTTEEMRVRAADLPWADPDKVPEIDLVWRGGPYRDLTDERFDAVFSSHNIEHQPCLVTHLCDVASLLRPGGRFFMNVPDMRYCFDHYLNESTIADALEALVAGRTIHSTKAVVEHRLLLTHNEATGHWAGNHGPDPRRRPIDESFIRGINDNLRIMRNNPGYIDVHAWQFTPPGFRYLMTALSAAGLMPFQVERVYSTVRPNNEFHAVLGLI